MQIDSKKCDLYIVTSFHNWTCILLSDLSYKGSYESVRVNIRNRVQWHLRRCDKNCQEIGSIVGGSGSSLQCSYTITMFLLTQVERSIIIYVSRPLCNKNVARDNLRQFRTNSSMHNFYTFQIYFKIESRRTMWFVSFRVSLHVLIFRKKKIHLKFIYVLFIFKRNKDLLSRQRYLQTIFLSNPLSSTCNTVSSLIMSTTYMCTRIHKIGVQWERHAFEHRILASYESFRE